MDQLQFYEYLVSTQDQFPRPLYSQNTNNSNNNEPSRMPAQKSWWILISYNKAAPTSYEAIANWTAMKQVLDRGVAALLDGEIAIYPNEVDAVPGKQLMEVKTEGIPDSEEDIIKAAANLAQQTLNQLMTGSPTGTLPYVKPALQFR
ncbi:hypothetical protein AWENTII_008874 [Aspergillus wentii]|nr:hypothetical protein MW887_004512 [Aspergillus wentii]